jgi:hypothetical protein
MDRRTKRTVEIKAESLLHSPEMFLLGVDLENRAALFLRLTPDAYKETPFLDDRAIRHAECVYLISLDELFELCGDLTQRRPLRYIFHTGLCCSTLLARCVEMMAGCLVLKEPFVLHQLSAYRLAHDGGDERARGWAGLLALAAVFLSRAYRPSDAVIVKADCNFIIDSLLELRDDNAALLLYPEMPAFILSVLKEPPRAGWARRRLEDSFRVHSALGDRFGLVARLRPELDALGAAEAAGCFWLSHVCLYREILESRRRSQVMALEARRFLECPHQTLAQLASFFGLKTSEGEVGRIVGSGVMQHHSKKRGERFDAEALSRELRALRESYGGEFRRGLDYVARLRGELGLAEGLAG